MSAQLSFSRLCHCHCSVRRAVATSMFDVDVKLIYFCLYCCAAQIGPPSICWWVLSADECRWKYIDNARPEVWYSCQRRQIVFQSMVIYTSSLLFRYCCFGLFYLNRTKWCLSQFEVAVCGNKGKVNRILKDQQRSWKSVYQRKNPNLAEKEVEGIILSVL